jgi:ABC-type sugar transport system substrate-binding protein
MMPHRVVPAFILIAAMCCYGCRKSPEGPPQRTIAGIVFQEDQFFRLVLFGMREAAAAEGIQLLEANSAGRPDKEIQLVNTYIAQGVDAIVISPLSATASVSALERARSKGIAIITYNTTVERDIPLAYIESDQGELGASTGRAARAYIERHWGGKATVALLAFDSQAPEQSRARTEGFTRELASLPEVRIVARQDAWLAEQAVRKAGDILTANPDVNVLWAANEGGTVGAVMAVRNSRNAGRIVVFGTDAGEQLADFLLADDGILQAVTGQEPFAIGTRSVTTAVKALRGEAIAKRVSLPGRLLTRDNRDDVWRFKEELQKMLKSDTP